MKKLSATIGILFIGLTFCLSACGTEAPASPAQAGETISTGSAASPEIGTGSAVSADIYEEYKYAHIIRLSADGTATLDGAEIEEFDYTWHADPSVAHDEVKNCPAEYFTGAEPQTDSPAYIAHDIYYYPQLDEEGFIKVDYDGEQEYAYYYRDGENDAFIFSTLPVLGSAFPSQMMHSPEEAYANPVLHITEAGTYIVEGSWQGQLLIDLGDEDENFTDENATATIILNGADISCSVAPAVIFRDLYECDNGWEERSEYSGTVDTADAGANVIIADSSVNNVSGANVFRMLKNKYKNEDSTDAVKVQKKAVKTDGAFYSYVSMNINGGALGTGILNITGTTFEGLDSELHLTVNGGNINIFAADDGINVNEDFVSVFTMNGGYLHIYAGLGAEGDGIDSNGYITVNGGTLIAAADPRSDNGLDSESGTVINGGNVISLGSSMGGSSYSIYVDGKALYDSSLGNGFAPDAPGIPGSFRDDRDDMGGERPADMPQDVPTERPADMPQDVPAERPELPQNDGAPAFMNNMPPEAK